MKKISILIIAICFGGMLKAQQLPQITQYMLNNYAVNPAVAGMDDYLPKPIEQDILQEVVTEWLAVCDIALHAPAL